MVISGSDRPRRIAARSCAKSLGIDLQREPARASSLPMLLRSSIGVNAGLHPENIFDPELRTVEDLTSGSKALDLQHSRRNCKAPCRWMLQACSALLAPR